MSDAKEALNQMFHRYAVEHTAENEEFVTRLAWSTVEDAGRKEIPPIIFILGCRRVERENDGVNPIAALTAALATALCHEMVAVGMMGEEEA